jgi:adenylate cyclase
MKGSQDVKATVGKGPQIEQPSKVPRTVRARSDSKLTLLEQRLEEAELLLDVSRRMAGYDELDDVLRVLVEMSTEAIGTERGTLFMNDVATGELYSRFAQGNIKREIRILNHSGIAGAVFTTGEALLIEEPYKDPRFNRTVDEQTGFVTRNILCVPIRTVRGEIIGVAQTLNKHKGRFTKKDLERFEAMIRQGALALQSAQHIERMKALQAQELEFIDVVAEVTGDIKLSSLLSKVMTAATKFLNADRSTLFLNDEKTSQLWSEVGQGLESMQIRLPNHLGIAGAVFQSGKSINIPHAYADMRFNPAFDKKTGYFTRSILCVPIINKAGKTIGVTQVLNKHGGPFSESDEGWLRAFTAQIAIALENAKLFTDVQNMKNYNEAMLESMSNTVITMDDQGRIVTCNAAGLRLFQTTAPNILMKPVDGFFAGDNGWVLDKLSACAQTMEPEITVEAELKVAEEALSVNLTAMPLLSAEKKAIGSMLLIEDISSEKRLKSTMSRYMDPGIADKLVASGAEALGGQSVQATILFSDIRGFTSITESLGAQGTVMLLNEYFTLMVDCIQQEGGMLDKFIGDAIMAAFGIPMAHDDDPDRAVRASIAMIKTLRQWNEKRLAEGKHPVDIGIGLNSDTVVSGNIGSKKRMDYTVIGDGVNLASRLESACKGYGSKILISEFTYKLLRGTYFAREIDLVVVKGKTEPVAVYEILDFHTETSYPHMAEALRTFRLALGRYRSGKWSDAKQGFADVLEMNPDDKAAKLYIDRCEFFQKKPPADGWDGVWVMHDK